ncbi:MAG: GNAT family N-acetyltransferase [Deltaproteobacteria bacterium]|nr:GNAT family N-acetyltransferase [Deltaproteobacteria bacterium]MCB9787892.1 GNAT family N-acetyltransferase [Deltaproteobacteria bacterium]
MDDDTPRIQRATLADVETLLEMMLEFNGIEGIPWSAEAARAPLEKLLISAQLGAVGLIFEGDTLRGYCVLTWGYDLEWSGRDAFLTELYLLPEARRRGLGRDVMALIEALAIERGARALHLVVRPDNEGAVRLYRSAGFQTSPRLFMTKALPRD